ncbi:MAG: hypothetical protein U5R48_18735 [Gammaproteobacteria bacterium]|nr:hypothetical protein [Gammaproteobacteria bacterium]
MRAAGLYPLVRPVVRRQVVALHERLTELMAEDPEADLLREYVAVDAGSEPAGTDRRSLVRDLRRDALGIPRPTPRQLGRLFAAHAPVWSVQTRSPADRPGALQLERDGHPVVDSGEAVEYRRPGWTRFEGSVLLQLEYTLWFPARAARGAFDPYAGELDAVTWRVTLTTAGEVLAYDSIHACGCYYSLFPGPGWRARTDFPPSEEPVFAPLPAPRTGPGEAVRVRLEADRHYLLGVEAVARGDVVVDRSLGILPADRLRSLPLPGGGRAGIYAPDGLVPASARPERFFLWPLGVPGAGAMRQDGHHAIAFVGRRHFDDPFLLESLLERRIQGSSDRAGSHRD